MYKNFTILLSLFTALAASAQVGFLQNNIIDGTYGTAGAKHVMAVDMDGDSHKDLLSTGETKVVWYKNINGTGNFSTHIPVMSPNQSSPRSTVAADLDGDGDTDVAFIAYGNGADRVYFAKNADGLGHFAEPVPYTAVYYMSTLQICDVDNDGDNDIAFDTPEVKYLNNNGAGVFTLSGTGYGTSGTTRFLFTDFDNDGDQDFIHQGFENVQYWTNNGNGTFTYSETISTSGNHLQAMHASDIDSDGDKDLLYIFKNGNITKLNYFKNTNGVFGNAITLADAPHNSQGESNADIRTLSSADIDNDGDTDVIISTSSVNKISLFINQGNEVFGSEVVISSNLLDPREVRAADLDSDGFIDIISASREDDKTAWYKNNAGTGTFTTEKLVTTAPHYLRSVHYGDIDGDGDMDLASGAGAKLAWYKNTDGLGTFANQPVIITNTLPIATDVKIMDADGDGDNDVFAQSWNQEMNTFNKVVWFENTGGGNFSSVEHIVLTETNSGGNVIETFTPADMDNDGDLDVISSIYDYKLMISKNNGNGTYAAASVFSIPVSGKYTYSLKIADLDNDGDKDVVTSINYEIAWHENTGNGTFSPKQVIASNLNDSYYLTLSDLDGDGDQDILYGAQQQNKLGYIENLDGAGSFGPPTLISADGFGARAMHTQDIDGDGDPDILSSAGGYSLSWMANEGNMTFSAPMQIPTTLTMEGISSIQSVDMNADGILDLLTSSFTDEAIAWFANLGPYVNAIQGTVKLDIDNNGCGAQDTAVPQVLVTTEGSEGTFSTFTQPDGTYRFATNDGTYVTAISSPFEFYTPAPATTSSQFTGTGTTDVADFCIVPSQLFNDADIVIYPLATVQPGFEAGYKIIVHNKGTNVLSGIVTFTYATGKLTFMQASQVPVSQAAGVLIFDFEGLLPFHDKSIDVNFTVATIPTVLLGDTLEFTATITEPQNDANPDDNEFELSQIIIGSYDPNDITVLEGEAIIPEQTDDYLHYIIRFQNTGTAPAQKVRVYNQLDDKLDWTTMQLESYSHANRVEITDGNQVNFIFNAIYLPDSTTNEPGSHGYIAYRIKLKPGAEIGDIISNNAQIYFDFNPAINTNTVTTEIVPPVESISIATINGVPAMITTDNGTLQLNATVLPAEANQGVNWSIISGSEFATVNTQGLVTAVANGTVQAASVEIGAIIATITIEISGQVIPATSISIAVQDNAPAAITTPSGTLQLTASVLPASANQNVVWSIINGSEYATVNTNGIVTAIANGTVTVQVASLNNSTVTNTIDIAITGQTLSLNEVTSELATIYPNPAGDVFTIQSAEIVKNIEVYNLLGQKAFFALGNTADVSSLPSGTYIVKVAFENGVSVTQKFVKE